MMRELVIVSGKGGTGKTSITAGFASLAANCILCDADVDAADLHLLMQPVVVQTTEFMGGSKAEIRQDDCVACGTCRDLCLFDAIRADFVVDPLNCEGCGVCVDFCPEKAIDFPVQKSGEWYISDTKFGPMVHARLGIAQENSGKLVSLVRREAEKIAQEKGADLILTDGPPGIGCPVIAAIGGATALVIIVEPTVSGIHDLQRVAELAEHFKVPAMVCINKFDLNAAMASEIKGLCAQRGITVVGSIPFDPIFTKAMIQGKNVFEYDSASKTAQLLREVWAEIMRVPAVSSQKIRKFL
ncbi:MAG: 4Fe-4S binding protein [Desulfocapsaceae bacterium]|nr:4Fe-4S binding protein [Desulfocapsaceae bacterium]